MTETQIVVFGIGLILMSPCLHLMKKTLTSKNVCSFVFVLPVCSYTWSQSSHPTKLSEDCSVRSKFSGLIKKLKGDSHFLFCYDGMIHVPHLIKLFYSTCFYVQVFRKFLTLIGHPLHNFQSKNAPWQSLPWWKWFFEISWGQVVAFKLIYTREVCTDIHLQWACVLMFFLCLPTENTRLHTPYGCIPFAF